MKQFIRAQGVGIACIVGGVALALIAPGQVSSFNLSEAGLFASSSRIHYEADSVAGTYRIHNQTPSIEVRTRTVGPEAHEEKVYRACQKALRQAEQLIHARDAGEILETVACVREPVGFDLETGEYFYAGRVYYSPTN